MRNRKKGLTLLELMVAVTLLGMVVLTASSVLVTFKKFYFDFLQSQQDMVETSLVVLEDIAAKIKVASDIQIGTNEIFISIDNNDFFSLSDDTVHDFYLTGNKIRYKYKVGSAGSWTTQQELVDNVQGFNFQLMNGTYNTVKIDFAVATGNGANAPVNSFETTIVAMQIPSET